MNNEKVYYLTDEGNLAPQRFKYLVEECAPKFTSYDNQEYTVCISLNENPEYHSNSSIDCFGAVIKACADAMCDQQFKTKSKKALVFNDEHNGGSFIAACVSDYDKDGENYFFNITFDESDIDGAEKVNSGDFRTTNGNIPFVELFNTAYLKGHNIAVVDTTVANIIIKAVLKTIFSWLDENARDGEIVKLIITDRIEPFVFGLTKEQYMAGVKPVAICSVETNKDIKKMSVQFSEELKAIAKGDSDLNS